MSDLIARLEWHEPNVRSDDGFVADLLLEAAAALRQKEQTIEGLREECEFAGRTNRALRRELAELRAQQPPREPTKAMLEAAIRGEPDDVALQLRALARKHWVAMHDAVPTAAPPAQQST